MNNCLILLTNYYPFHKGEEYLESEIIHLSEKFKKIYIIPTMVSNTMKRTRNTPPNTIVLPVGINHSKLGKIKMVLNQFENINKNNEKKFMIKKDSKGKFINKLYCYYFESRAMDVYEKVEHLLKNENFDEYESITIYSYWLYITARVGVELKNKLLRDKNTYTISRAHRYDLYEYAAPLKYLPERDYLLKSIDNIFPCSQDGVNILNKTYPMYKDKIDVRRLGTVSKNLSGNTENNKLYIVSCSAVRKVKRLDLLVNVLVDLEKNNIPYLWTHIGGGPELEKIKKLAKNKINKDNFNFTGFIKNEEVLNWYESNTTTVFINLSSSEGVPVSIMEALSMGIPVIATNVGGTREIVENGINGYLVKENCTVEEVSKNLLEIYNMNNNEYDKLCENALNIWNKRSNADILYSDFASEISNINRLNKQIKN